MIAADTSTWIAFLKGSTGRDVQVLDKALELVEKLQLESVTMLTNVTPRGGSK